MVARAVQGDLNAGPYQTFEAMKSFSHGFLKADVRAARRILDS